MTIIVCSNRVSILLGYSDCMFVVVFSFFVKSLEHYSVMITLFTYHIPVMVYLTPNLKLQIMKSHFPQYVDLLESVRTIHSKDRTNHKLVSLRPSILRSLFTVGLFCKHFDMDVISQKTSPKVTITTLCFVCVVYIMQTPSLVKSKVLPLLVYFTSYDHNETQLKAVTGLGKCLTM